MTVGAKFGKSIHYLDVGSSELIIPQAKVGVEVEIENWRTRQLPLRWTSHDDGSLRNGREFVTDGGLVGRELVEAVMDIAKFCKASAYSEGYPRAGIHIHVDMTDMNDTSNTQLLHCVLAYMLFEDAMFSFAGRWRKACGFCDPLLLSQSGRVAMAKFLIDWEYAGNNALRGLDKYAAMNFLPLATYGTVEFRALPTTFDAGRILNWINFCLAFKHYGKFIDKNPLDLLNVLGVEGLARAVFLDWYPAISPHISALEVAKAATHICGFGAGIPTSGKEFRRVDLGWEEPTNELLLNKLKARAGRRARTADPINQL